MLRQYHCSPHRLTLIAGRPLPVGLVPVGAIRSLNGEAVIVQAWLPRACLAARRDDAGLWVSSFHARGMFLAQVRRLSDGQRSLATHLRLIEGDE